MIYVVALHCTDCRKEAISVDVCKTKGHEIWQQRVAKVRVESVGGGKDEGTGTGTGKGGGDEQDWIIKKVVPRGNWKADLNAPGALFHIDSR